MFALSAVALILGCKILFEATFPARLGVNAFFQAAVYAYKAVVGFVVDEIAYMRKPYNWHAIFNGVEGEYPQICYRVGDCDLYWRVYGRDGGRIKAYVSLNLNRCWIYVPTNRWRKHVPIPHGLFLEPVHISLTNCSDGWCFPNYEALHHMSLEARVRLSALKGAYLYGEASASSDNKVVSISKGSELFAFATLLQSFMMSGDSGQRVYRNLHISVRGEQLQPH